MKRYLLPLMIVSACVTGCWLIPAVCWGQATAPPASAPVSLEQALKDVPAYEFGKSRESLTVVSDAVRDSQSSPDARKGLVKKLLDILKGKATLEGKQFVCRQLSIAGNEECVPILAPMLDAKDTSDMARYALERIPGEAADKALLAALGKAADAAIKIGLINSLGVRQCAAAVGPLGPLAANADPKVAEAAIAALGKIGGPEAIKELADAKAKVPAALHAAWVDAYLLCADKLRAAGDNEKAGKMCEEMSAAGEPDKIKVAAFRGRVAAAGDKGVSLVVDALAGDNAKLQAAATQFVREMPGKPATEAFAALLPKLAAPGQVLLLSALGDRADGAALAAVTGLAKSDNADVRVAALAAMGKVGDASCVPALAQAAAKAEKAERDATRNSLDILRGADVDAAMAAHMKGCEAPVRAELARSLAARNASSAVPALLETAKDADENVRAESFRALGILATAKELPALVDLLIGVQGDNARREAEKAVVTVAKGIPEENQRAAAVLAALPKAGDAAAKCSMMNVLGQIGDNSGLDALRDAANKGKDAVKDAAVRALAGWPNIQAIDDLMKIADKTKDDTHRMLALRGLVRLLDLPGDRKIEDTLKYYETALKAAESADEKKAVLSGLANVKNRAALALVAPLLANEELKQEAGLAAQKIRASGYKVSASVNNGEAVKAVDLNMESRWHSGAAQQAGMFYMVDQDASYEVSKIILDSSPSAADYPRGYQVFISDDQNNWGAPVAEGKGSGGVTEIAFTPKKGRYIKIVQTGSDEKALWGINELKIESK